MSCPHHCATLAQTCCFTCLVQSPCSTITLSYSSSASMIWLFFSYYLTILTKRGWSLHDSRIIFDSLIPIFSTQFPADCLCMVLTNIGNPSHTHRDPLGTPKYVNHNCLNNFCFVFMKIVIERCFFLLSVFHLQSKPFWFFMNNFDWKLRNSFLLWLW